MVLAPIIMTLGLAPLAHSKDAYINAVFVGVHGLVEDDTRAADWKPEIKGPCDAKGHDSSDYTSGTQVDFHIYSDNKCESHLRNMRNTPAQTMRRSRQRRDTPAGLKCNKFDPDPEDKWNFDTWTRSYRVSSSLTCPAGQTASCPISVAEGQSLSFTIGSSTSISATAAWDSVSAGLDTSWGQEDTTTVTYSNAVDPGRTASLVARMRAVEIPGWYRECTNGEDYRGEVVVPKKGSLNYYLLDS